MKKIAVFIGYALSFISAVFSAKLLIALGNTGFDKLLYTILAFCFQTAQIVSFLYGWSYRGSRKSVLGFTVFGCLLMLSLCATIGSFAVNNRQITVTATATSPELVRMNNALNQLNTEINNTQAIIADCASKKLLTKCVNPQTEQLKRLQADRGELLATIQEYKATPASDGMYDMFASFFGVQTDTVKLWFYVFISVVLDLSSVSMIAYGDTGNRTFDNTNTVPVPVNREVPKQIAIPEKEYHEFMQTSHSLKDKGTYDNDPEFAQFIDQIQQNLRPAKSETRNIKPVKVFDVEGEYEPLTVKGDSDSAKQMVINILPTARCKKINGSDDFGVFIGDALLGQGKNAPFAWVAAKENITSGNGHHYQYAEAS